MGNDILLYGQIVSIFTFIIALFILYRLIVQKKDATVQFLEKQLEHLKEQIASAGSDTLSENLERRISILTKEIKRLNQDKDTNTGLIKEKELELDQAKGMYERLQKMTAFGSGLTVTYFCPVCNEATIEYVEAKIQFLNTNKDSFLVRYKCGYSILNGKKNSICRNENNQ